MENIFWAIQSTVATSELNPLNNFSMYIVGLERAEDRSIYKELVGFVIRLKSFIYNMFLIQAARYG